MKKIIYSLVLFVSSILYSSCNALDMAPEDYYGSGNFWNNEAQVKGYLLGMHAQLRDNYTMFFYLGEARGGTQRTGTSSEDTSLDNERIKTNLLDKDNTGINNWNGLYNPLMNVNHFIQKVETECPFLSEASRKSYLAPAYGIRALYYFMLYRTYGGVPLVTTVELLNGKVSADKFYIPRATPEETLALVKSDINKSETLYGSSFAITKRSEWSKAATLMLKAEVYLWSAKVSTGNHAAVGKADLEIAKTALQPIIGKYELLTNFQELYSTKESKEIIFSIHFADTEASNWGGMFLYQNSVFLDQKYGRNGKIIKGDTLDLKGTGGVFRHEYKESFWRSYDETDTRRDATFMEYYNEAQMKTFGVVMKKGIGSVNATNNRIYDNDILVYRYADALLMMAEVENGLGNPCANYINEIRKRAYGKNYSLTVAYLEGSYAENELAILKERDKEFVWEGKRWFDVVRMHAADRSSLAFSALANYPNTSPLILKENAHLLLWPIDVNTLTNNKELTQTPGY